MKIENLKVTDIQIFPHVGENGHFEYSANIAINDKFMIQRGTDGKFSVPTSNLAAWSKDEDQDQAEEYIDNDMLSEIVEKLGIETTVDSLVMRINLKLKKETKMRKILCSYKGGFKEIENFGSIDLTHDSEDEKGLLYDLERISHLSKDQEYYFDYCDEVYAAAVSEEFFQKLCLQFDIKKLPA